MGSHIGVWIRSTVILAALLGLFVWWVSRGDEMGELPPGITPAEYRAAERELFQEFGRQPSRVDVLFRLAGLADADGRYDVALACLEQVPSDHPEYGLQSTLRAGDVLGRMDQVVAAEERFASLLKLSESDQRGAERIKLFARERLVNLMTAQFRYEERQRLLGELLEAGTAGIAGTLLYCFPDMNRLARWALEEAAPTVERWWQQAPDDPHLIVAVARYRTLFGKPGEAVDLLEPLLARTPENLYAQAACLEALIEMQRWDEADRKLADLPPLQQGEPWLLTRLRGRIANHFGRYDEALKAFQHHLREVPTNAESWMGIAAAYAGLDQPERRAEALEKAAVLARIRTRLGWVRERPMEMQPLIEIAELCQSIGLTREAELVRGLVDTRGTGLAGGRGAGVPVRRHQPSPVEE